MRRRPMPAAGLAAAVGAAMPRGQVARGFAEAVIAGIVVTRIRARLT